MELREWNVYLVGESEQLWADHKGAGELPD
jgi:hypothetical protein